MNNRKPILTTSHGSMNRFELSSSYIETELIKDTLVNLLQREEESEVFEDYMSGIQFGHLTPDMRRILIDWMKDVLVENRAECDETLSLSLNLMDRVLARVPTNPGSLQLVGSACLLISSKLKERHPLKLQRLSECSGFAFDHIDLKVSVFESFSHWFIEQSISAGCTSPFSIFIDATF
jgi:hypothetical protein